jgi:glucose dehydrogenase
MQEDKAWDRIVDAIDTKFGVKDHGRSKRPVADQQDLTEKVAFITFDREGDTYKLERVQGPAIIDRKTIGARRAGASVRYQNVYDREETSFRTNLYRQEAGEWSQLDPKELGL